MVPFCELATRDATQIIVNSADAHKYGLRKHPWHYRHYWKLKFLCAGIFFFDGTAKARKEKGNFFMVQRRPTRKTLLSASMDLTGK